MTFIYICISGFIYVFIMLFLYLYIYFCIYLFLYLFIYAFIYLYDTFALFLSSIPDISAKTQEHDIDKFPLNTIQSPDK